MTIDYETVTHNTGEFNLEEDGPKGIDAVTGFGLEAHYDYTDSPNEQLGQGVGGLGGASAQMAILNDPNATAFEKAQALAKLSQLDPSAVIAQAKNAVKDGIKDAVKDAVIGKLTGGLFGNGSGSGTPTMGASPALIQISNQGGATAANNNNTTGNGGNAGAQNFGESVVSNISRNLGFG